MVRFLRSPLRGWPVALLIAGVGLFLPRDAAAARRPADAGLVSVSAGRSGFRDHRVAMQMAFTYHHRAVTARLRPAAGVLASTGGDVLLFTGVSSDVTPFRRWGLTPLLSAGYYSQGSGSPLGGALEFRSSLNLWLRTGRATRVGFSVDHISNAGLFEDNPGRESVYLTFDSLR